MYIYLTHSCAGLKLGGERGESIGVPVGKPRIFGEQNGCLRKPFFWPRQHPKKSVACLFLSAGFAAYDIPTVSIRLFQPCSCVCLSLQIRDKWIPGCCVVYIKLITEVVNCLRNGDRVVVHCYGGKGRSGTLVCAILMALHQGNPTER